LTQGLTLLQKLVHHAKYTREEEWVISELSNGIFYFWDAKTGIPHMALRGLDEQTVFLDSASLMKDLPAREGILVTTDPWRDKVRIWKYCR